MLGQSTQITGMSSIGRSSLGGLSLIAEATIQKYAALAAGDFSGAALQGHGAPKPPSSPPKEPPASTDSPGGGALQGGGSVPVSPSKDADQEGEDEEDPDEI